MTQPPPDRITETAKALGLDLPEACRDGVATNLDLLAKHTEILEAYLADEAQS